MRIPVKGMVRTAGRFLRKNDTKILAILGKALTVAAMGMAVRGGMKAGVKINEAEKKLKEENPEAVLPTKEKAKIIAKEVTPAAVMAIGGVVSDCFLFKVFAKRTATATAIAEYYAIKPMLSSTGTEKKEDGVETVKADITPSFSEVWDGRDSNFKFDIYEPFSKRLMKNVSIKDLYRAEIVTNHMFITEREFELDWIIGMLGGGELDPKIRGKYGWECPVDGYGYSFADYTCNISFKPCLDMTGDRLILLFDTPPKWLGRPGEEPERPKTLIDNAYVI